MFCRDGSNSNFSFSSGNAPMSDNPISTLKSEGWITSDRVLVPEHDAATVHWGGTWRMPTKEELDALNSNCDWTWATINGVNGYVVRGRGEYASNSIFLPALCRFRQWGFVQQCRFGRLLLVIRSVLEHRQLIMRGISVSIRVTDTRAIATVTLGMVFAQLGRFPPLISCQ